jgi:hypothetical protein
MPNPLAALRTWVVALCCLAAFVPLRGRVFGMSFSDWATLSAKVVETEYYIPGHCPDSAAKGSCTHAYTWPDPLFSGDLSGSG